MAHGRDASEPPDRPVDVEAEQRLLVAGSCARGHSNPSPLGVQRTMQVPVLERGQRLGHWAAGHCGGVVSETPAVRVQDGSVGMRGAGNEGQHQPFVRPFPWSMLEQMSREDLGELQSMREMLHRVGGHVATEQLQQAAQSLLGTGERVTVGEPLLRVTSAVCGGYPTFSQGAICLLRRRDSELMVLLECEAELAFRLASTVLGQRGAWLDRSAPPSQRIDALWGAFVVALMHRSCESAGLHLAAVGQSAWQVFTARYGGRVCVDSTVRIADGRYGMTVRLGGQSDVDKVEASGVFTNRQLRAMGQVPLRLCVVASLSVATREQIASVCVGDVWVVPLASGQTLVPRFHGEVLLMTHTASMAWRARIREQGGIVVTKQVENTPENSDIASDFVDGIGADSSGERLGAVEQEEQNHERLLGQVPVVVRIEVGSVTLSARQWASLRTGDVITTGCAVGRQATLRIGGIEVARGDLVDVQGQLGVRVREMMTLLDAEAGEQGGVPG